MIRPAVIVALLQATSSPALGDGLFTTSFDTKAHENEKTSVRDTYGNLKMSRPLARELTLSSRFAFTQFHEDDAQIRRDQLWSLSVAGSEGPLRCGARVYSVGEAFDDSLFGSSKLAGLTAASDGHEVWATLKGGKFTVRPRAQSMTRFQAGQRIDRTQQEVNVVRPLLNKERLIWNWRNRIDEPLDQKVMRSQRTMSMKYAQPRLQWTVAPIESKTAYTHHSVGNVKRRADVRLSFDDNQLLPPVAVRIQLKLEFRQG